MAKIVECLEYMTGKKAKTEEDIVEMLIYVKDHSAALFPIEFIKAMRTLKETEISADTLDSIRREFNLPAVINVTPFKIP